MTAPSHLLRCDEVASEDVDHERDVDDQFGRGKKRRIDGGLDVVTLPDTPHLLAETHG